MQTSLKLVVVQHSCPLPTPSEDNISKQFYFTPSSFHFVKLKPDRNQVTFLVNKVKICQNLCSQQTCHGANKIITADVSSTLVTFVKLNRATLT